MRFVQAGVMLLGSASYLGVCVVVLRFATSLGGDVGRLIFGGWNALLLVVTALVIIDSVRKVRAGKTSELARDLFVVKLAGIPFFSINFIVLASIALLGSVTIATALGSGGPEAGGIVFGSVALTIGLTYLAMLTTSTYGWATIVQLRRDGRIGPGLAALYRVMLLLFVVDVVAAVLLYVHSRRGEVTP